MSRDPALFSNLTDSRISVFCCNKRRTTTSADAKAAFTNQMAKNALTGTVNADQPEPLVVAATTPSTITFIDSHAIAAGANALNNRMRISVTNSVGDTSHRKANTRGTTLTVNRKVLRGSPRVDVLAMEKRYRPNRRVQPMAWISARM